MKNIHLLQTGHYMIVKFKNEKVIYSTHKYLDYRFSEPKQRENKEEYKEELNRLFIQAVKRQLVSDVELGSY